ncbi:type I polyketide synthase [Actinokineospora cianjurensis]|uniref:Acyl transferase domain-containing protein n=1 Tax=Actinokineospora cianjurensis TaxID=585224 RepID=A0A421B9Q6_9PSEU|nr:type I polyketide synthase [Actinokineospora cianjurensis]RLK61276.1 acyl transferase domain-containing protein [Actinokineospora cianjurensis]
MSREQQIVEALRASLKETERLRKQNRDLVAAAGEPIAIVGMACRLPGGVTSPDQLWDLVSRGGDGITGFPGDRGWDLVSDVDYARAGGFVDSATTFDAGLFGISPREAVAMDPQQRLLLESSWEALERAGIAPDSLRGSATGVYAGASNSGYGAGVALPEEVAGHALTGTANSVISGRVAYALGLEGPAVTIDTACSSSLVALHMAMQALRADECSMALVGGVTVVPSTAVFAEFARQNGLAADGRCKSFAGAADGTGWSEGVAVLVVEKLSDAVANGHDVLAVVRGSAVNSDGASNGLTAPNGPSQQRVIRAALESAGMSPSDVDVVEGHGTGTRLGDPIEAQALLATYGQGRVEPLWLGSLKSNIGHTQAASGAAGVIKMVLALQHATLPKTLHVDTPTPHAAWGRGAVSLLTQARPWPEVDRPRRAAVSSFGISGTNAHIILESYAAEPAEVPVEPVLAGTPWALSARSAEALRAQADRLAAVEESAVDIAWSLATTRAVLDERAVVVGGRVGLDAVARGESGPGVVRGTAVDGDLALLFTGQGSQRAGMGQALRVFPVFAEVFDDLHARLPFDDSAIDQTGNAQVALFALQVALFRLVESWGIRPDVLVGHSIGEVAAAHVSGILSLDDACTLVAARARLMQALPSGGAMLAVEISEADLAVEFPEGLPEGVDLAAVNSDRSIVVSGDRGIVELLDRRFVEQSRRVKRLSVSHAFHSHLMDPMLDEFERVVRGLTFGSPAIPVVATSTGDPGTPEYWVRQVRETVRFADAVGGLDESTRYLELGPDGVLSALVGGVPALRAGHDEPDSLLTAVARLHVVGVPVDWTAVLPRGRRVPLPVYPFQRAHYWLAPASTEAAVDDWRYRIDWSPVHPRPAGDQGWQVIGDDPTLADLPRSDNPAAVLVAPGADPATVIDLLRTATAPIWVLTRGAVSTSPTDPVTDPAAAQLWGLGQVAALEHPDRWGGLIDLDATFDLARLAAVLAGDEDQVALRGDATYARRLVPAPANSGTPWRATGTVLITGGTGALGGHVARWLAGRGAQHLLLTSRRGPDAPGTADLVRELATLGTRAEVIACDVADRDALTALLAEHTVTAAFHTAGVVASTSLAETTVDEFTAITRAKADGAATLHELLPDAHLVLFGSIAGVWGSGGQAAYAAANAHLDAIAAQRRAQGKPATCVSWGPWAGSGMLADADAEDYLRKRGLTPMSPVRAVAALGRALDAGDTNVTVVDIDGPRFAAVFTSGRPSRLLPWSAPTVAVKSTWDDSGALDLVRAEVATVLGYTGAVDARKPFKDLGFDSLTAVELRDRLVSVTGQRLPASLVYDYPTATALAEHLRRQARGETARARTEVVTRTDEPIAIIAMSCRFPGGVDSPEALWDLVANGREVVDEFPTDRGWDLDALRSSSHSLRGAFLRDAAEFDADLFGISPREATVLDPQQRFLLEATWEVFERAGIDPTSLRGEPVGVFAGTNGQDYAGVALASEGMAGYLSTGITASVLSGRIAYSFGLEGPAVTVDTACSSSLVALHLAAKALRDGECSLALASGVTVMATPGAFVEFTHQRGLAADGRCKPFAQAADGTSWGEGVGVLLVERLSDAVANGHRVLAVVRGSAVNSDGASNGLTAPNGPSQQRVILSALAAAGLTPSDVDAVEAHGTGTVLGDPIEAQALLATYGQDRATPLWLGSVKSNIGHTQAAAGVAAVIKMVQAMRHGVLPMSLHIDTPTAHVDWSAGAVSLLTESQPWTPGPRRVGVSSFGVSGTNAHVILESAPESAKALTAGGSGPVEAGVSSLEAGGPNWSAATEVTRESIVDDKQPGSRTGVASAWVLSAGSAVGVREQAARLARFLEDHPTNPEAVARTLVHGRAALGYRAVVPGGDLAALGRVAEGGGGVVEGSVVDGKLVYLFTGQGSQRAGMGRELRVFPVFAAAFDEVVARVSFDDGAIDQTGNAQVAIFALQVALHRLLESLGIHADVLVGHSIGEVAAAHVSGILSLDDACTLVSARARLMQALPPGGAMLAVEISESDLRQQFPDGLPEGVDLAAVNSDRSIVVSGDRGIVELLDRRFVEQSRRVKRLVVSHAFHSHLMDPMLGEFEQVVRELSFASPTIPLVNTSTGDPATPEYWVRQVRETVRFHEAVSGLGDVGTFVELGPDGVLTALVRQSLDAGAVPLVRAGKPEIDTFDHALATLFTRGVPVQWPTRGPGADLPTYAFQRRHFWARPKPTPTGLQPADHPLLTGSTPLGDGGHLFTGTLPAEGWLADHVVHGAVVLPGTALLDLALHAGATTGTPHLDELTIEAPLTLPATLQLSVAAPTSDGSRSFAIHSTTGTTWTRHASGVLSATEAEPVLPADVAGEHIAAAPSPYGTRSFAVHATTDATWTRHASGALGAAEVEPVLPVDVAGEHVAAPAPDGTGSFAVRATTDATWTRHASGALSATEVEPVLPVDVAGEHVAVAASTPDGTRSFGVHATTGTTWARHASGVLGAAGAEPVLPADVAGEPIAVDDLYPALAAAGLDYGPAFQGIHAVRRTGQGLIVEVSAPVDIKGFGLHPALFDAVLHALALDSDGGEPVVPFAWTGVTLHAAGADRLRAHLTRIAPDAVRIVVTDDDGAPVASVESLTLRVAAKSARSLDNALFTVDWVPVAASADIEVRDVVVPMPDTVADTLALVQAWIRHNPDPRLVLVSSGAVAALPGDDITDLAAAASWGLVRSAQSEHPDRFVLVDAAQGCDLAGVLALDEPQLAVRDGMVLASRLVRAQPGIAIPDEPWRLDVTTGGTLENLAALSTPDQPLRPGEVRVAVRSAGINFRDVLIALGSYPEQAVMGSEGAGVVVEVGAGVTDLAEGDRVFGLLTGGFGPHAVVDRRLVAPMPESWSYTEAAAVPMAFLTAYYALVDLAGLRAGERVLVHAAAGGVGMAATQIARHLGAHVSGTASPAKWPSTGLADEDLASSRDLGFEQKFGATGFDVVLNSLAGEYIDASRRLLGDGGRFIEMGKADLRDPAGFPGLTYRAFDLGEAGPDRLQAMLQELIALFGHGGLRLLPTRAWDIRDARSAFRHLGQGRHVGKNVFTIPRPLSTVLITGGTGVLGSALARHLVDQGVRRLVLVSRSGQASQELPGADVTVVSCDISDPTALSEVIAEYQPTDVIHAAGVADDGLITDLTPDRLQTVFGPKADAARVLASLELDSLTFYSSASATFGTPGQANYSAANAYLDALAHQLRAQGKNAVSLAWGLWAEASGITASLTAADRERLGTALSTEDGLALFDRARTLPQAHVLPMRVDARSAHPLLRGMTVGAQRRAKALALTSDNALDLVREHVAAVLGHASADAVDPRRAFRDLGFDSLTSVELRNRINSATGLRLPPTVVFDHPTPVALAALLSETRPAAKKAVVRAVDTSADGIVIVGMACRFPGGVGSPEELWDLVVSGVDAIGEFPRDRGWDLDALYDPDPERLGTTYTRAGGFVSTATEFDAGLFGISPREAAAMDPQQRLLLETTWEAFERAGIDPMSLHGSKSGVFMGVATSLYGLDSGPSEGHSLTGIATSVASGRLAYTFGLEGPALTVDTACSSSLVALHLAVQALRNGECTLAVAGGATVMATPGIFTEFSRQKGLSVDGRCRSFAADADGTGWGEGVGILVVERRSDAVANGHEILAVVRGTAVNSDGASNGLTAPNGPSQQRVIEAALAVGGLAPSDVDLVEAHGTGTVLGDPIEAQALLATYGQDRAEPLWLGSVKSNIGHTQSASGVAGVIKVVEALRRGVLPGTLHAEEPTPHVDWTAGSVSLLTESRPWPRVERPRRAGVSSFGVSGTNAHVIIEQAGPDPVAVAEPRAADPVVPWVLSAASADALRAQASRLAAHSAELDPVDVGLSLVSGRADLDHRLVVVGATTDELRTALIGAEGQVISRGRVAFLFTGQGSQQAGMGQELRVFPAFKAAFDDIRARLPYSDEAIDETGNAQLALFAVEVALFRLLESWGVRPDVLVGHSIGEVAAAHVSGILSLDDACALVAARARLMQALPSGGAMLAVEISEADLALEFPEGLPAGVDLAAVNSDRSIVVSGDRGIVELLDRRFVEQSRRVKRLVVSHAFHSHLMDPMLGEFRQVVAGLSFAKPTIPLVSTAAGDPSTPEYWVRQVQETVRFSQAVRESGAATFVEVGPGGVLSALVHHSVDDAVTAPAVRPGDEVPALVRAVGTAWTRGVAVDWSAVFAQWGGRRVALPTYAFQRSRYWLEPRRRIESTEDWRYQVDWAPVDDGSVTAGKWAVQGAADVAAALKSAGVTVVDDVADADGLVVEVDAPGLLRVVAEATVPVWAVTRGGVDAAEVWGVGRVAAIEMPQVWGGLIDLPAGADARVAAVLGGKEDQVVLRPNGAVARRVRRAPLGHRQQWTVDGPVLITGGTGALGLEVARWLVTRGATEVVLVSRRGGTAPDLGVPVYVETCDIADRDAVSALLARHPVTTIVHAAGVDTRTPLISADPTAYADVTRAKVLGARHLHELAPDAHLIFFSSIAGVWGSSGQSAYAAGNAYLDALAEHRVAEGRRATSLAWGPWSTGMAAGSASDYLRRRGLTPMRPDRALSALGDALDGGDTAVVIADVDWERFIPAFTSVRPSPLLAEFVPADSAPTHSSWASTMANLSTQERLASVLALVRKHAADALGHPDSTTIEPGKPFKELGFDSLTAVDLRNRLATTTAIAIPATAVFDHPTARALAEYLISFLAEEKPKSAQLVQTRDTTDPVVIVGMACRYPGGVNSPEDLWDLVTKGTDAIADFPTDRGWDLGADVTYARRGGFVDTATQFDADLFSISPREALAMDPQQRLVLETAWEAFERAGVDPLSLRGSATGVFVGASNSGYGTGAELPAEIEGHFLTGTANSVMSGRIAYTLGLEGPAVTVDTACSSSLVALHWAIRALRDGECDLALAGGVTVIPSPAVFAEFATQGGLAADGRCKAFADAADGTGWSEGVGVLVVERLSDALRNGHRVLAVVRGSAVNSDGASNGLTAPNGPSQQRVIKAALASGGLTESDVDAVEGHGTGTRLGDPIEAQALLATYGQDRDEPLWLGSLKSNIGHAQAASGVGGVIKMVLALRHGVLPRTLHVDAPSSHVTWGAGAVSLLTESRPWPEVDRPRRAAVSSFGVSGTNAHTILEEYPGADPAVEAEDLVLPWVVSGRSAEALRAQALRLKDFAGRYPDTAVARALVASRADLSHRAVVTGAAALEALIADRPAPGLVRGVAGDGRLGFLFTGQGSQRVGMGRGLYSAYPVFAAAFDAVCARVSLDEPLADVVFGVGAFGDGALLDQTAYAQAGLFALQVAVFRLVESWGIRPDHLVGHSIGELAAAHVAGVLSLDDACVLLTARARLMQALPPGGAMLAVEASEAELAAEFPEGLPAGVDLAAVNSDRSLVLSGDCSTVELLNSLLVDRGRRVKRLSVSHAFHSHLVDPVLGEFAEVVETLAFRRPEIPLALTSVGDVATPEYWVRQVRETVRFADAVRSVDVGTWLELGPDGVLAALVQQTVAAPAVPVLRGGRDEVESTVDAVGHLHVSGARVDWTAILGRAVPIDLPTYAFQRERYWLDQAVAADDGFWAAVESGAVRVSEGEREQLTAVLPMLTALRRDHRERSTVDSWRYRVTWRPLVDTSHVVSGRWLVITPDGAVPDDIAGALAGVEIVSAAAGALPVVDGLDGVVALVPVEDVLSLVQADLPAPLWCVTRGAVAVDGESVDPEQARVWGLGRVAALEVPGRWGGLVDVPAELTGRAARRFAAVLAGDEREVAVRASGVFGRRLRRAAVGARGTWSPDGPVLVTGGTGALGAEVARWLVEQGTTELVLVSRRGPDAPGAAELVAGLDASVSIVACDVADRDAVARLLAEHPVRAVFHAAGTVDDGVLDALTKPRLDAVLRSKSARWLDELAVAATTFVVFSSLAGVIGSAGQGNYAAANAELDALIESRRARGLPGLSVAWGPWSGAGMAADVSTRLRRGGLRPLAPRRALTALATALSAADTTITIADVDWPNFTSTSPLLEDFPTRHHTPEPVRDLLDLVITHTAAILGHPTVAPDRAFRDLGIDSLTALELRNSLAAAIAHPLPASVVFDYPTPAAVAAHLETLVIHNPTTHPQPAADPSPNPTEPVDWTRAAPRSGWGLPSRAGAREPGVDEPGKSPDGVALDISPGSPVSISEAPEPGLAAVEPNRAGLEAVEVACGGGATGAAVAGPTGLRDGVDEDSVVIVGMACRLPGGAEGPEGLWRVVRDGVDGMAGFPDDRGWDLGRLFDDDPERVGTSYARVGGFLSTATEFDAALFGISPREAVGMDPQQRLMLEASWAAIEDAGIDPRGLKGSRTGVFAGTNGQDYPALLVGKPELEGHIGTGNAASVLSGRIAYTFGLEGPALTVDTACSSSLVALHLAAKALRGGECDMALAGGVTIMSTPGAFIEFSRQRGLAPDGRCKAFAAAADGTGWGEGVGVLVVMRLGDALKAGRRVLAVVRGTAVNQDGASNGLTAPNGPAQQRVIEAALADAHLRTSDVDVVEAHGTGTSLGDPIEAQALLNTYGQGRDEPLWIGSVKSNIGHTQAAAGVAGIIKVVMAMRHRELPKTLHVDAPSAQVDWSTGDVALLTEPREWPADRPRRAGISSFGVSGTNAHVIVEDYPAAAISQVELEEPVPFVLSAASPEALIGQARALLGTKPTLDVAASLLDRAKLPHRAVVIAADADEFATGLRAVADKGQAGNGGLAILFTGQGSQRARMGRELRAYPVFAQAFDDIREQLSFDDNAIDDTVHAQAAIFALEVALYRLVESWGIAPDVLIGHSIGEVAAAHVSGVLSLDDACALVAARGRLMQALPVGGAMLAVEAEPHEIDLPPGVALAAVNGPRSLVVSGDEDAVDALAERWSTEGRRVKRLVVSHAFHSHRMDPMLPEFGAIVHQLTLVPGHRAVISTVHPDADLSSPDYWVRQVREPVRFTDAVAEARRRGVTRFLELGPDGVLTALVGTDADVAVTALRAGKGERETVLAAVGRLHEAGVDVDWRPLVAGGRQVPLPAYAFDRQRFWPLAAKRSRVDDLTYGITWAPVAAPNTQLNGTWAVLGDDTRGIGKLLESHGAEVVTEEADGLAGIVSLLGLNDTVDLLKRDGAPIWCVTEGAVSIDGEATDPERAQLWGLGRVAALERPRRWGGLIDGDGPGVIAALAGTEDQVAVRNGELRARRLTSTKLLPAKTWRPTGPVLVTGGTGALGIEVARWLVDRGADELVLVSRRGADAPGIAELVESIDARVHVVSCDLGDEEAVRQVLRDHPVTAIVHAAGVAGVADLVDLGANTIADALRAKATGARHLDELATVDTFVLFSSIAGVWGSGGQAAYAAANAALDAIAHRRHAEGKPVTSVAWGPWAGAGMAAGSEDYLGKRGLTALDPAEALEALGAALDAGVPTVTVADVDWPRFADSFHTARSGTLFTELLPNDPRPVDSDLRERLAGLSEADRDATLLALVTAAVAEVLGYTGVDPNRAFRDLGFDSLTAVELRGKLVAATGLALPSSLAFDYPTATELARHLRAELSPATGVDALLAELDAVESAFAGAAPDGLTRIKLAVRLRSFLAGWDGAATAEPAGDLDAADDDEFLSLIDQELGR